MGPGSKDYLTYKAQSIVESSDIVMGSRRALEIFPNISAKKLELDPLKMEKCFKQAVSLAKDKSVVIISTGDPGFSGVLKPILKISRDIDVEVVPGISSLQLCASKLKISWDDADLISLHGKGISDEMLNVVDNGKPTIIIPNFDVDELLKFLIDNGVDSKREVAICEKLSYPDERLLKTSLEDLLTEKFSYMCVVVIF